MDKWLYLTDKGGILDAKEAFDLAKDFDVLGYLEEYVSRAKIRRYVEFVLIDTPHEGSHHNKESLATVIDYIKLKEE